MEPNRIAGNRDNIYFVTRKNETYIVDINSLEFRSIKNIEEINEFIHQESYQPYIEKFLPIDNNLNDIAINLVTGFSCNYSCQYCYQKKTENDSLGHLKKSDVDKIIEFYKWLGEKRKIEYNISQIGIVGGEPLLPGNEELINYIIEKNNKSMILITTNGTYLMDYFDIFSVNKDKIALKVSLDGSKEQHYKNRKPADDNCYDMTIKGIKELNNIGIDISVSCVFDSLYEDYSSFFDKLESIGWLKNKNLKLNFLPKVEHGADGIEISEVIKNISSLKKLLETDERTKHINYEKLIPGMSRFNQSLVLSLDQKYDPYRCETLYKPSYTFLPDGSIHFCIAALGENGIIGTYKPIYNIREDFIRDLLNRRIDKNKECKQCKYKVFCQGECPATSLSYSNNNLGHSCKLWKDDTILNCMEGIYG